MTTKHIPLWEMSNLLPVDTGLNQKIWISTFTGKEGHWARIKVEIDHILYSVTIEDNPQFKPKKNKELISTKDFQLIQNWIIKNQKILLKYWNSKGEMSAKETIENLKKVSK